MHQYLKLLLALLISGFLLQPVWAFSDTTKLKDITFTSPFEKSCFQQYLSHQTFDTIGFLLATNTKTSSQDVMNVKNALGSFVERINTEGGKKKKNFKKFADYLFEQVHAQFLKKYQENVPFDKIFSTGTYNCLTASALYALIFERLGIRYEIKETPTHVYIIADPGATAILIETTDPSGGYFAPDNKFKKEYVNELVKSKVITTEEVASEGIEMTFEKHFYENESIDFKKLVGLHYYNKGIAFSELDALREASNQFEKGYLIYPSTRIGYSMRTSIAAEFVKLGQEGTENIDNIKQYLKILDVDTSEYLQEAFIGDFLHLTEKYLIEKDNEPYYLKIREVFQQKLTKPHLLKRLQEIDYAYRGKAAILKGNMVKGREYFGQALKLNPSNIQYSGVVVNLFALEMGQNYRTSKSIDTMQAQFDNFAKEYPFLTEHKSISTIKGTLMVSRIERAFEKEKIEEGVTLQKELETYLSNHQTDLTPDFIASPYLKLVLYYINKKDYDEAKKWIEKGIASCPTCVDIPKRLKALGDDIQLYHLELPEGQRIKAIKLDSKAKKKN